MSDEAPDFEYPLPGEDIEVTVPPTQEEADESRTAWQDGEDPEAFKTRTREDLNGMGLAWWSDTSFANALGVLDKVLNSCVDTVEIVKSMRDHGLPEDILASSVSVNLLSGPIIMSALQALGVLEPLLRDDIYVVLKQFADAMPVATEEENALLEEAGTKAVESRFAQFAQAMAAEGAVVLTEDDLARLASDETQEGPSASSLN